MIGDLNIPYTTNQWSTCIEDEFLLPKGTHSVWLKITSHTPITHVKFYGHLDCSGQDAGELTTIHRWIQEDGESLYEVPRHKKKYIVACGKNPRNHTIEMSIPSVSREMKTKHSHK